VLGAVVLGQPRRDEPTDRTTPDDEDPSHARTLSDRRRDPSPGAFASHRVRTYAVSCDQSSTRRPRVGVVKRTGEAPSSLGINDV
jgi:hypothetical protein